MTMATYIILPMFVLLVLAFAWVKGTDCFKDFTTGAKDGIRTIFGILPSLVGLFAAISVFKASGAMEALADILAPVGHFLGIKPPLIPLVLMRPVSGSASLSMVRDILVSYGVDSDVGKAAAVMMGSTETVFYTLAVYLGSSKIKKIPGVLIASLGANFVSSLVACWLCS